MISVIIAVKNGERTIKKCLGSVFGLRYHNFEVIVVNDGSTDSTKEILSTFKIRNLENKDVAWQVIDTSGLGPSEARNLGVKQANGEYVVFTDADCMVAPSWLNELMKGFELIPGSSFINPQTPVRDLKLVVGVGGLQLSPEDDTSFGRMLGGFLSTIGFITDYIKPKYSALSKRYMQETSHNPSCNVMYKKEIFEKTGGFLKGMWPGEDVEFDYRLKKAGYILLFNPGAVVFHYRCENLRKFRKMMLNYGRVQGELVKMHGFFRKIQYVPMILAVLLLVELAILLMNLKLGLYLVLAAGLTGYVYFLTKARKPNLAMNYLSLMVFTLIFWNYGFVKGITKNRR